MKIKSSSSPSSTSQRKRRTTSSSSEKENEKNSSTLSITSVVSSSSYDLADTATTTTTTIHQYDIITEVIAWASEVVSREEAMKETGIQLARCSDPQREEQIMKQLVSELHHHKLAIDGYEKSLDIARRTNAPAVRAALRIASSIFNSEEPPIWTAAPCLSSCSSIADTTCCSVEQHTTRKRKRKSKSRSRSLTPHRQNKTPTRFVQVPQLSLDRSSSSSGGAPTVDYSPDSGGFVGDTSRACPACVAKKVDCPPGCLYFNLYTFTNCDDFRAFKSSYKRAVSFLAGDHDGLTSILRRKNWLAMYAVLDALAGAYGRLGVALTNEEIQALSTASNFYGRLSIFVKRIEAQQA